MPMILSCGPLSYRVCVCVLIDVCVQRLLYKFRGQHKILTKHSRSKSSTKPLDLPIENGDSVRLFSHHPIPLAMVKYTPYEPYMTYFDRQLYQSTVFTTALIQLCRLKKDMATCTWMGLSLTWIS